VTKRRKKVSAWQARQALTESRRALRFGNCPVAAHAIEFAARNVPIADVKLRQAITAQKTALKRACPVRRRRFSMRLK
jgi:hypothetical protein